MKSKYLIRLDDACSQMNKSRWQRMEAILDKYEIKPMVGIIPNNEDPVTCIDPIDPNFVVKALNWQKKGWAIALHGYNHICTTTIGGINPVHKRSEFAGISLSEQKEKISKGYKILVDMGLIPQYFFAPSHTFDRNTLKALAEETSIRIISDTIALYPYRLDEFAVIPCQWDDSASCLCEAIGLSVFIPMEWMMWLLRLLKTLLRRTNLSVLVILTLV